MSCMWGVRGVNGFSCGGGEGGGGWVLVGVLSEFRALRRMFLTRRSYEQDCKAWIDQTSNRLPDMRWERKGRVGLSGC